MIGMALRMVRLHSGDLTQAEISKRTGITQSTISRIERGSDPKFSHVLRILEACGWNLTDLAHEINYLEQKFKARNR